MGNSCKICIFAMREPIFIDNKLIKMGLPIGCFKHHDIEHQTIAKECKCCDDFKQINSSSKAILVIDMPNCCDECFALEDNGDYPMCLITQEQRGYTFRTRESKMDKCPLRPIPEKFNMDVPHDRDYDCEYEQGYNACIDEILGGK